MPKCLRCGAGSEWIEGRVPVERATLEKRVRAILEEPFWLNTLDPEKQTYERQHDDTDGKPEGFLMVSFGPDSDAYISIDMHPMLRFRTEMGGGLSQRTRNALIILAEAMRLDNAERPQRFTRKA